MTIFSIHEHGIALHLLSSWVSVTSFIIISFPPIDLTYYFLDLAESCPFKAERKFTDYPKCNFLQMHKVTDNERNLPQVAVS